MPPCDLVSLCLGDIFGILVTWALGFSDNRLLIHQRRDPYLTSKASYLAAPLNNFHVLTLSCRLNQKGGGNLPPPLGQLRIPSAHIFYVPIGLHRIRKHRHYIINQN